MDVRENTNGEKILFERIKGAWILEAINLRPIEQSDNENFVEFFGHFATDSLFQSQRVREPLAFVTSDPDDDFSILETTLDLNQWFAFKPVLPVDRLSNINYGQRNDDDSPTKILALKGIGNGFPISFISAGKPENGNCISLKIQVSDTGYDAL